LLAVWRFKLFGVLGMVSVQHFVTSTEFKKVFINTFDLIYVFLPDPASWKRFIFCDVRISLSLTHSKKRQGMLSLVIFSTTLTSGTLVEHIKFTFIT
jgi:hypothetical protein